MFGMIWPVLVAVAGVTLSQIFAKETSQEVDPFASLSLTYTVACLLTLIVFLATGRDTTLIQELQKTNWSSWTMGFTVLFMELGHILFYRRGWKISVASLVANISASVILMIIGVSLYGDHLKALQYPGIVAALLGLVLVNLPAKNQEEAKQDDGDKKTKKLSFAYFLPLILVIATKAGYHVISKETPSDVAPFVSFMITYFVGAVCSFLIFSFTARGKSFLQEIKKTNYATWAYGLSLILNESGFLYIYRSGWKISLGNLVASISAACLLVVAGFVLYKEKIRPRQAAGIVVCMAGMLMINM